MKLEGKLNKIVFCIVLSTGGLGMAQQPRIASGSGPRCFRVSPVCAEININTATW